MPLQKSSRRRGCILSVQGQNKLNQARSQVEQSQNCGDRYTYEQLSDRTGLSFNTIVKILKAEVPVDRHSLDTIFQSFGLLLERQDYRLPESPDAETLAPRIDWAEAPDVMALDGDALVLGQLTQWIDDDRCKLVALLGMGGIGKTTIATQLTQQLASELDSKCGAQFECVIWRSLRNAPNLETLLIDLIPFLSSHQETQPTLAKFLYCVKQSRCLIVLDNVETVLESQQVGQFRAGFEDYEELLRLVAETEHRSCVLLTSREKPAIVATLEGVDLPVRSLRLEGSRKTAQTIFQSKGLIGTPQQQQDLGDRYSNSPLALKIVATSIQTLFDARIDHFLKEDTLIFNGIRRLFDQQFQRLSSLEKSLMYWLAINREWTSLTELQSDLFPMVPKGKVLESLEALSFRSWIERQGTGFTQQPVVMEYVTERFLEQATTDFAQPTLDFLTRYAVIKATAKDYIRQMQMRLILEPLCDRLLSQFQTQAAIVEQIQQHLEQLRGELPRSAHSGYGGGNLINLLCHLQFDFTQSNFSNLTIRQAYLRKTPLHRTNFSQSRLIQSIFSETLTDVFGMDVSPDGSILACGFQSGV